MLADIRLVQQTVQEEFLRFIRQNKWTKDVPVGFLVANLVLDGDPTRSEQIDAFGVDVPNWPEGRNYEVIARGKLALCLREGMESLNIVANHPWLLRHGDCRYGGGVLVTYPGARTQIWVAFSGLDVDEDIALARMYGFILIRMLNDRADIRIKKLDASDALSKAFMP